MTYDICHYCYRETLQPCHNTREMEERILAAAAATHKDSALPCLKQLALAGGGERGMCRVIADMVEAYEQQA